MTEFRLNLLGLSVDGCMCLTPEDAHIHSFVWPNRPTCTEGLKSGWERQCLEKLLSGKNLLSLVCLKQPHPIFQSEIPGFTVQLHDTNRLLPPQPHAAGPDLSQCRFTPDQLMFIYNCSLEKRSTIPPLSRVRNH